MRRSYFTVPDIFPNGLGQQVHLRTDRRAVVPQGRHLPRQGAEPDAVLSPARHGRRVEPRLRLGRFRAVPVRGAHRGRRGVQGDHRRHPDSRSLLVPQRVQAVRARQPSAAELPDSRLERLRRLPDQGRPQRVPQRTRPAGAGVRRPALHRQGHPHHRRDLPRHVPANRRVDCRAPQGRSATACSPPTWPDAWSCSRWCAMVLDAVGNPQTILLLGGTSEIGLAICERYLRNASARIVLADLPDDPRATTPSRR